MAATSGYRYVTLSSDDAVSYWCKYIQRRGKQVYNEGLTRHVRHRPEHCDASDLGIVLVNKLSLFHVWSGRKTDIFVVHGVQESTALHDARACPPISHVEMVVD